MQSFSRPEKSASEASAPVKTPSKSRKGPLMGLAACILLIIGGTSYYFWPKSKVVRADLITHVVKPEKLQITVLERGTLEALDNKDVICQVRAGSRGSSSGGATTIKWVIDDGSHVKLGDLLVELDDSALQEQLKSQQIVRDRARNDSIQAEANYDIVKSQSDSDLQTALVSIELSELDRKKFLEGDFKQQLADLEGRILLAESDFQMWQDRDVWLDRMVSKGYLTPKQALADRFKLQSANFAVEKVREEMRVLKNFTYERTLKDLDSKIAEAKRAKERLTIQSKSKEIQAINDSLTKKSIFQKEDLRFKEVEDEIKKCYIYSPQDGLVVYYVPEQARFGSGSVQATVAQGEPVREGQKLMRIPNLSHMLVNTRVHEAMRSKIRGDKWTRTGYSEVRQAGLLMFREPWSLLANQVSFFELRTDFHDRDQELTDNGLPVLVRIDAFPDKVLQGHVKHIDEVAAQSDWLTSDIKVYRTLVSIDESLPGLKPGMSASVTIFTDTKVDDALAVPVQAVLGSSQTGFSCFVMGPDGAVEKQVKLGVSNEKMVEVKEGLNEGDVVVLNPRNLPGSKNSKSAPAETPNAPEVGKKRDKKAKSKTPAA